MLSVFVVPSVSVESAMECQMTCLMKCFLRCVSHHVVVKSLENTWDLEGNVACGVWICHRVGHVRRCAMWEKPAVL